MNAFPGATVFEELTPRSRAYLRALPPSRRIESAIGPLLLCHGFANDDMMFLDEVLSGGSNKRRVVAARLQRLVPDDIEIVVAGHTHRRGVQRIGRLTVVNPGTLRSGDNPCFAIADLADRVVHFFDFDDEGDVLDAERVSMQGKRGREP